MLIHWRVADISLSCIVPRCCVVPVRTRVLLGRMLNAPPPFVLVTPVTDVVIFWQTRTTQSSMILDAGLRVHLICQARTALHDLSAFVASLSFVLVGPIAKLRRWSHKIKPRSIRYYCKKGSMMFYFSLSILMTLLLGSEATETLKATMDRKKGATNKGLFDGQEQTGAFSTGISWRNKLTSPSELGALVLSELKSME